MKYKIRLFRVPLLLLLIVIQTEAKSCVEVVSELDNFRYEVFQEREIFLDKIIEKYKEQFSNGGNGFNFTANFPNEPYKLNRMRQKALDFYWHGDVDKIQQRYQDMEFLAILDGLKELENLALSRLEPFQYKTEEARKLENEINEIWREWEQSQQSKTHRDNCTNAIQVIESDWREFRKYPNRFREEFLRENLQAMKGNATKYKNRSAKLMEQLNRESYNSLYHLKDGLNMISHIKYYDWAERFFGEYLEWLVYGQRPAPDSNCASFNSIPAYREIMTIGEEAKNGLMLLHAVLVQRAQFKKENLDQDVNLYEIKEDLHSSSFSLELFLQQQMVVFSNKKSDKLYERYQMTKQLAQYEALVDFYHKVIARIESYYNQNEEYFNTPSAIDPVPIEKSLSEIDQEFEHVAQQRNRGCEHWSAVLEADLKVSRTNPSGPQAAAVAKTFQALKKIALEMKTRVSKLYDKVPRDHSRYLQPDTELALIEAEKKYQRLANLFSP